MNTTFEDFLKDVHAENYYGTDDDMPDAFDDWVSNDLMREEVFAYVDKFASQRYDDGVKFGMNTAIDIQKDIQKSVFEARYSEDPQGDFSGASDDNGEGR